MAGDAVVGALRVVIGADSAALDKGLKDAQNSLARFSGQTKNLGLVAAGAFAGVAAGATMASIETEKLKKSTAEVGVDMAKLANTLKTVGVAAYTLSPAFRALVNPAIAAGARATGSALAMMAPSAAAVATTIGSRLIPALSMVSKVLLPIQAAVTTWQALNYVWKTGASLLEKYANASRIADISSNLAALTKFQTDTISASQVRYATELGARLQDANFQIKTFLDTHIDITNPALKIQSIWVGIVEAVGSAATKLNAIFSMAPPSWLTTALKGGLGATPIGLPIRAAAALTSGAPTTTAEEDMAAARARLGAAMGVANIGKPGAPIGGSFDAVFADMMHQLANVGKVAEETGAKVKNVVDPATLNRVEAYIAGIEKQSASLQAELSTVGMSKQAHETLRVTLEAESIAKERNIEMTAELQAKIQAAAASYGELSQKVEDARMRWQIVEGGINTVASGLTDIAMRTKTAAEAFRDMATSILRDISQMIIKSLILRSVQSFMGGPAGTLMHTPGGFSPAFPMPIGSNAMGTDFWRGGPTWVGERGPEIVDLPRGARVTANNDIMPNVNVSVHNYGGDNVDVRPKRRNSDGSIDLDVIVGSMVDRRLARGDSDAAMARYGAAPTQVRR